MLTLGQPNFSLYALIDWQDVESILVESRRLLEQWSVALEMTVIEQQLAADLAVGFQRIERITPILPRYRQLAAVVRSATVVGLPDSTVDLAGLNHVALRAGDSLVKEWFLIVKHRDYNRALIARETDGAPRSFHGVLTSNPAQVKRYYAALTTHIQQKA